MPIRRSFVRHAAPGCEGRQNFRYILDEQATGVFQGKIVVDRIAQKTDGRMLAKALVLSDDATMNSRPELEIFADDVACGHGATIGGLNADQLFYLEARGLPRRKRKPCCSKLSRPSLSTRSAMKTSSPPIAPRFRPGLQGGRRHE